MAVTIYSQPSLTGTSYSRSPIVFRYKGCDPNNTYMFNMYISGSTTREPTLTEIYASINRVPDLQSGITIDCSNLITNYIRDNINYNDNLFVYFKAILTEYDNSNTLIGEYISYSTLATMGYIDTYSGIFNSNINPLSMSNLSDTQPNYLPNYGGWPLNQIYLTFRAINCTHFRWIYGSISGITYLQSGSYYNPIVKSGQGFISETNPNPITNIVELYSGTTLLKTYTFFPEYCNGNELIKIKYMNKFGVWDFFFFKGRKDDSESITSDIYKYQKVNYDTMKYNISSGSYHKFNSQGKEKMILNTGWIDDVRNIAIKDLFLSEYILYGDIPYIITDKDIKYKTSKWDKLINYTITFEKAWDTINNII